MGYILHDDNTFIKDGHKQNKKFDKKKYKRLLKMKKNSKRKNRSIYKIRNINDRGKRKWQIMKL